MKKAIAVLLAFALVGAAFAQDEAPAPYFTGGIMTGIRLSGTEGSNVLTLKMLNDYMNGVGIPNYAYLGMGFDAAEWGVFVQASIWDFTAWPSTENVMIWDDANANGVMDAGEYEAATIGGDVQNMQIDYAYAYYNFADLVKLQLGILADYTFATYSNSYMAYDLDCNGGAGSTALMLTATPIDGLTLGMATFVDSTGFDLSKLPSDTKFMAKYANSDLGLTAVAGYNAAAADKASDFYFGAKYTGMENLLADLEFAMVNIGENTLTDARYAGKMVFTEVVKYTMDALVAKLTLNETMWNNTNGKMVFTEVVKYTMDALVAKLTLNETMWNNTNGKMVVKIAPDVSYKLDAFTFGLTGYFTLGYYAAPASYNITTAANSLNVKPYINIALGDTTLKTYFSYTDYNLETANNSNWKVGADMSFGF